MVYPRWPTSGSPDTRRVAPRIPAAPPGLRFGAASLVSLAILLASGADCAAQDGGSLVLSSDARLAELASGLLPDLARRSGMELRAPVRVEERTRAELVRYLEHKLDEELPPDKAQAIVDSYALLGLVPPDFDLRGVLLGLYTEQVAGFYEPDSTALFVMDDQAEADLRGLLVHELVHAVQDQSVDLDALTDAERGSDRARAAHAAIEGQATLVMLEYVAEQQMGSPVDLSRIAGFGALLRQNLQGVRQQFPALASAPAVLRETLIFPYVEGAVYLQERWSGGERIVPFADDLPLSTEQVLSGGRAAPPVELGLEVEGGELVHDDVLGRLELGVLLAEHLGSGREALADGWEGDRYGLVRRGDGTRVLLSYTLWEDAEARDRFTEGLTSALGRFGAPAVLETVEVSGRPATRLTVGDASGITVRVSLTPSG